MIEIGIGQSVVGSLANIADKQAACGVGTFHIKGLLAPPMVVGDAERNVVVDYQEACDSSNLLAQIYIRKFETMRVFANQLEKELEALRRKLK